MVPPEPSSLLMDAMSSPVCSSSRGTPVIGTRMEFPFSIGHLRRTSQSNNVCHMGNMCFYATCHWRGVLNLSVKRSCSKTKKIRYPARWWIVLPLNNLNVIISVPPRSRIRYLCNWSQSRDSNSLLKGLATCSESFLVNFRLHHSSGFLALKELNINTSTQMGFNEHPLPCRKKWLPKMKDEESQQRRKFPPGELRKSR
jgi:hypothetical protein